MTPVYGSYLEEGYNYGEGGQYAQEEDTYWDFATVDQGDFYEGHTLGQTVEEAAPVIVGNNGNTGFNYGATSVAYTAPAYQDMRYDETEDEGGWFDSLFPGDQDSVVDLIPFWDDEGLDIWPGEDPVPDPRYTEDAWTTPKTVDDWIPLYDRDATGWWDSVTPGSSDSPVEMAGDVVTGLDNFGIENVMMMVIPMMIIVPMMADMFGSRR